MKQLLAVWVELVGRIDINLSLSQTTMFVMKPSEEGDMKYCSVVLF